MHKNTSIAGVLLALYALMCLPSSASAEDFRHVVVFLGLNSFVSLALGVVCCWWIYKKTANAWSWLLLPLWAILVFASIYIACVLVVIIYEHVAA